MGRHYEDDQRDTVNRFRKRRGGLQRGRQRDPGQKELVLVIGHDPGGHFGFERPEPDLLTLPGQEPGQGSSPGARADHRDRRAHFKMPWSTPSRSSFSLNSLEVSIRSGTSRCAWKDTCPMGRDSCWWTTPSTSASAFSGRISSIFSTSGTMFELSNLPYALTMSWMIATMSSLCEWPFMAFGMTFTTVSPAAVSVPEEPVVKALGLPSVQHLQFGQEDELLELDVAVDAVRCDGLEEEQQ